MRHRIKLLQEFSIPLISGVVVALILANLWPTEYHEIVHGTIFGEMTLHFFVNDIFMVFFFAIAAVEIKQSLLPGGALNPIKKAVNPLMATLGGVLGPIIVYIILNRIFGSPEYAQGWGIPTATDIALAWLVARAVFGGEHPAVKFLLLLAVADDGVGLFIIAIFYPDPLKPVEPIWMLLVLAGMLAAYLLYRAKVNHYLPYIVLGGTVSWIGMYMAHLHPALALAFIIPFLPATKKSEGALFDMSKGERSALTDFEHAWKLPVDFGLFFFGLTSAGVVLTQIGVPTWLVVLSLVIGKTSGVFIMSIMASLLGFPRPNKMGKRELFLAGVVASLGLTVALFVAGAAFVDIEIQNAAKMGALFSSFVAIIAIILGRVLNIKRVTGVHVPAHSKPKAVPTAPASSHHPKKG